MQELLLTTDQADELRADAERRESFFTANIEPDDAGCWSNLALPGIVLGCCAALVLIACLTVAAMLHWATFT